MLKTDSRKIVNGDTFLALKGVVTDGHDYIDKAIELGATKIICEHGNYAVDTEVVPNTRIYLADYLKNLYKDKFKDVKFLGITGTNGKTTSAYLTYQLLNMLNVKTAYLGTIGFYMNDNVKPLKNTTPDLMELYEMFDDAVCNGVKVIVMEVSSHALELGRVLGLEFDMVAFTNLTQDHLDVHGNFDNYLKAKQILFGMLKSNKTAIVNIDDPYGEKFLFNDNNNITYGLNKADYHILSYDLKINKSHFLINVNNKEYDITIPIPGKYNIYNFLVALIMVVNLGFTIEEVLVKAKNICTPKGRFDIVNYNSNVIVVDYAHTPDAVENILKSVMEYKESKVYTILGCGGDRDKTKRPIMGNIAIKYSDYAIFTNDNPRTENEEAIMNDIVVGLSNSNYEIIFDRKKAIEKGISLLKENDILLILGKGHEDYQIIGTDRIHFDDKETVINIIK